MPVLNIVTNLPRASIPADFLQEATTAFQAIIGKPMKSIAVCVIPDAMMTFSGTTEPCALLDVRAIGKIGPEENKVLSAAVFKLIKEKLGIEGTRAYISFVDPLPENIGHNGTTIQEIRSKK